MKIFVVVILAFTSLLLMAEAKSINYKKVYCNNQEFVGTPIPKTKKQANKIGGIYPHLHCGKTHLTLSRSKNGGRNNLEGDCNKVNEILADIPGYYGTASNPAAITAVLRAYSDDDCPTESKLENLLQNLLLKFLQN